MKIEFVSLEKTELITDQNWWAIYYGCFPENERESKEVIFKSLDDKIGNAFAVKRNGQTIGIATTQLLMNVPCTFLIYLAMDPSCQGKGFGPDFIAFIQEYGNKEFSKKGMKGIGLVWEVEKPDNNLIENENSKRLKRIEFFKRLGGMVLNTNYFQPPVDGKNIVAMNLMYLPSNSIVSFNPINTKSLIHSIYFEKYLKVNNIDSSILTDLLNQAG